MSEPLKLREPELAEIVEQVRAAPREQALQHMLILGGRGQGKTVLLSRLASILQADAALAGQWRVIAPAGIPYALGELADLWLCALAAGGDEARGRAAELIAHYSGAALEEAACAALRAEAARSGRRWLLLVDRFDELLSRWEPDREASRLREVLQHETWLMLIGSASQAVADLYDYGRPLYDLLRVLYLPPLREEEGLNFLQQMALQANAPHLTLLLREPPEWLCELCALSEYNPRSLSTLLQALRLSSSATPAAILEQLLDLYSDTYQERMERLPPQAQRVFYALAQRAEPATAEELAQNLRLPRPVVSGQLSRLVERGYVRRSETEGRALRFHVRERLWSLYLGGQRWNLTIPS